MLTEQQLATLRALVDRIIPADDFPSGWQAGVGDYLAGQFKRDLRGQLDRYRAGLDALPWSRPWRASTATLATAATAMAWPGA